MRAGALLCWRPQLVRRLSQQAAPALSLTAAETKLFQVLQFIKDTSAPEVTLRVAGGWVRDKLLGLPSDDIDIALDVGTGEAFAQHILAFQNASGVAPKGFYIVKKNTDASKHLACATVKLLGHDLDFVHLRSETYADPTSRIPILSDTPATPTEDALRRDITINALFFNLSTMTIEDCTGQGLADLAAKRVRTPLPPLETFLDDPLRVLRAIRFACHYNFTLDDALLDAAKDKRVQDALAHKVSRERIGIEVRKMLAGSDPARAMRVLTDLHLWPLLLPRLSNVPFTAHMLSSITFVQQHVAPPSATLANKAQYDPTHLLASALVHCAVPATSTLRADALATLLAEPSEVPLTDLVAASFQFLSQPAWRDQKLCMDAIKDDLKWSKAEAKAIADVMDAAQSFVQAAAHAQSPTAHYVQLVLWRRAHGAVFEKVLPILWHMAHGASPDAKEALATFQAAFATRHLSHIAGATRNRLPTPHLQRLLQKKAKKLSELIEVVAVYEALCPDASIEDEEIFVRTVLEPAYNARNE
ncbi:hypothetical protein SPRG_14048 [Saprolegnia parasitica CBS 223.65]|uniref:Poly A polymerase head domain-containing protein n=1 Tax=Saprolegnia parasitica (strain CBS 223.65) TaxID=695850 RepID=A0A067C318_SAPPC|nr:hypothetical protein SPRG_14048 [Saprolegnia parasitica CBS 223.65]KDO20956.1 hypothetical protein SPRG_14048 [Saprolegnia parasitica CBS 223.65]|eukprot:XP_012208346.1 hypothetical protein SPRG_14048 [Saprolegnia parasitica CBS 223.65]